MDPQATRLYSPDTDLLARILVKCLLGFLVLGLGCILWDAAHSPFEWNILALTPFTLIAWALAHTALRAEPVFGCEAGLILRRGAVWITVPWSMVGEVECPISSFNPVFRTYYVEIQGEEKVYFYGDASHVELLESFRRGAA